MANTNVRSGNHTNEIRRLATLLEVSQALSGALSLKTVLHSLVELLEHEENGDTVKHAKFFRDKVVPAMATLRESGDALEGLVPQDLWPLPTYREMLFVK